MASSVTFSIATNSVITGAKLFGFLTTGSPTLFAETIHSGADVANQVLLKVGEVKAKGGASAKHPFGRGQERFFWALVSAISIFFVGCGVTIYHGVQSLIHPAHSEPFTMLTIGLLLFSLVLELITFAVALKEIGGVKGIRENCASTSVLAVLLEDAVAVTGILLTLFIALTSYFFGAQPILDATVSILVGVILGVMAIFLANLNRHFLIDVTDEKINTLIVSFLAKYGISGTVSSVVVDEGKYVVFITVPAAAHGEIEQPYAIGQSIKQHVLEKTKGVIEAVFWKFRPISSEETSVK